LNLRGTRPVAAINARRHCTAVCHFDFSVFSSFLAEGVCAKAISDISFG
jgi:hypothetical protein